MTTRSEHQSSAFIQCVRELLVRLGDDLGETQPGGSLKLLLRRVRGDGWPRDGMLPSGIGYQVHGAGARFTLLDGRIVEMDVDLGSEQAVWDAWRVQTFARSSGAPVDPDAIGEALRHHVIRGEIEEVTPGWFRVVTTE